MDDATLRASELLATSGLRFHALLARITLREDAADDLLQELFLRLQRSPGLASAKQPEAYAHRAAVRLAFDWRHAHQRRATVALADYDAPDGEIAPIAALVAKEELEAVLTAMEQLPLQAQQVLTMRFLESHSYHAIALDLGYTVHRARSICHKALARLRRLVDEKSARGADEERRDV